MSSFKLLRQIDKLTKYSVHGWIRRNTKQLNLQHIPSMIDAICILYFRDDERFAIINKRKITLSQDGKSITRNNIEELPSYWNISYGIMEVDSMSNMIYEWRLRIVKQAIKHPKYGVKCFIWFGITSFIDTNAQFYHPIRGKFYEFQGVHKSCRQTFWGYECFPYGEGYNEGDIVTICLDLKRAEIRLNVNEKVQEVAFENVIKEQGVKYRMSVRLPCPQDCVEILTFEKKIS